MPEDAGNEGFFEVPGTDGGILKKILREVCRAAIESVPA